ncbi:MAG: hypothetical protein M1838_000497 [Thelocarpon superellum]|nr:MAG: hypothetical protein M1838_000497 [Thelocarpon superellum]
MATLNLSTNGPSITKSYQSVVDAPPPTGPAASSSTYGQWAVFSVSAPLATAFEQSASGKESVLKVQSTGAGELVDLIEEFSDGRIQFAFVKVKDPNTALPKFALIGWCGEGVPERTKGYFTSHLAAVGNTLRGYHVQITARTDRDLTPEGIMQKVSDASGSKYSGGSASSTSASSGPPPPIASKPVFTPTRVSSSGGGSGFNPLAGARSRPGAAKNANVDADGWGQDAPPVTRTQLEKVPSAYNPTKVNMSELTRQKEAPSRFTPTVTDTPDTRADVVKGAYQPVGKVDIAALRRQAQTSSTSQDDRPTTVKGAYEPVGKVDIAAIRARAQPPQLHDAAPAAGPIAPVTVGTATATATPSERLTSLPKPRVANKFGSGVASFTGTRAPTPGGFGTDLKSPPAAPPVGAASRTFADEGGKTPAQLWAEKKARERGVSGTNETPSATAIGGPPSPMASQKSGGEWKSGYSGKSWAPVATTATGRSGTSSLGQQRTGPDDEPADDGVTSPAGGVGALRDRFKGAAPMGAPTSAPGSTDDGHAPAPPPLNTSNKPNAGVPMPGLPMRPRQVEAATIPPPPAVPRSPTPPTPPAMESGSPIRIVMPIGRGNDADVEPPEERLDPPAFPTASLAQVAPHEDELTEEPVGHDPARGAGEAVAGASFGAGASAPSGSGKRALVQYDYEKAEDNELDLKEGEYVTNIDMVDEDWWMGENAHGETGLFPSNYVELVESEEAQAPVPEPHVHHEPEPVPAAPTRAEGPSAVALYDYEAAEDNELTFAEGSKIEGLEFPDEDWWFGHHNGKSGLFPSNYVQLEE